MSSHPAPSAGALRGELAVPSSARASRPRPARLLPLLLLCFSFYACVLAGPTRQYGGYDGPVNKAAEAAARLAAHVEAKGSLGRQGCRGVLDICCHLSSSRTTGPSYSRYSGQTTFGSPGTIEEPSARFGQTMKLLHPLVSLAASPWCAPAPASAPSSSSPTSSLSSSCDDANRQDWDGFAGLRHVFSFGDSYTTTEFNWQALPYPSAEAGVPLGNPAYPGITSANGANWIDYLTVRYNRTLLTTYNLAVGGATAGPVGPEVPTIKSLRGQVHDWFMPAYAHRGGDGRAPGAAPGAPSWRGDDSVFTFWLGINDIGGTYMRGPRGPGGTDALNRAIILGEYAALAADLRAAGARNFVFVNVPPIDRSPLTRGAGEAAQRLEKADVESFNALVVDMARGLRAQGAGADGEETVNVWVYDSHAAFGKVMDDPSSYPQTAGYTNVEDFCEAYQLGTPEPDTFYPQCGVPVNQYLWLNSLHPTGPIHEVVAAGVADLLEAGPNIC